MGISKNASKKKQQTQCKGGGDQAHGGVNSVADIATCALLKLSLSDDEDEGITNSNSETTDVMPMLGDNRNEQNKQNKDEDEDVWLKNSSRCRRWLVILANEQNVHLLLIPDGMQRFKANATRYDGKKDCMIWKVEFIFHSYSPPTLENIESNILSNLIGCKKGQQVGHTTTTLTLRQMHKTTNVSSHFPRLMKKHLPHSASSTIRQHHLLSVLS